MDGIAAIAGVSPSQDVSSRLTFLEKENKELRSSAYKSYFYIY